MVPTTEPVQFVAGDTVEWTRSVADYLPAAGWTLHYVFVAPSGTHVVTCTDNGDGSHRATLRAAESGGFVPGEYHWQAAVSNGTCRYTLDQGRTTVRPNFAQQPAGFDARSHCKRVLDAIEAVLENRATEDQLYFQIEGKQVSHIPHAELIKLRNIYRIEYNRECAAERLARGLGGGPTVRVRF